MSTLIKVGGASLNQTPMDWSGNRDRILGVIRQAQSEGISILCLPELCISGYGCEDAFHSSSVAEMSFKVLMEIVPHTDDIGVAIGLPIEMNHVIYNAIAWVCNGSLCGFAAKRFLAGHDLYYESRWFKPWPSGEVSTFKKGSVAVPVGDIIFDVDGIKVGFEICEDAWVINRPSAQLALWGVDVILNASASHFAFDQFDVRCQIVKEGARATNTTYVYSNLLGCEAGRIIYDGTVFIASGSIGLVAQGQRFSFEDMVLTTAAVDVELNRLQRRKNTNYHPAHDKQEHCIFCPFPWKSLPIPNKTSSSIFPTYSDRFEEFTRAVTLGLWDYLRKSRSRAFVVSVSGGADSSTLVVLVYIMVNLALKELGWKGFANKLFYIPQIDPQKKLDISTLMSQLLLTIYQASEYSSDVTYQAARGVCEALHARFLEFNISEVVKLYTNWIEDVLDRPLDWATDDLAMQNIQARVRGPSAWLLANIHGGLLLSTSNRSEAAVGYATMDGDTCGGISPIAGIDKAFILRWLKWVETEGLSSIGPLAVLEKVTSQRPTAELRPPEEDQSDESDLMPYPLLDAIEKAAIRDRKDPVQVWRELQNQFDAAQYSAKQLAVYVDRFFKLWSRNQWKRERYAPSFHLDDENLDPKTWCRFPILSGGFSEELKQLQHELKSQNLSPKE